MKKAIIYVFSGTGNTLLAANEIKDALTKYDYECVVYNVRQPFQNVPNPNDYDVVGFGYPIHAFNTPKIFLDFVKELPEVNNKLSFIFKTSGEPFWLNNASSFKLLRIIEKKGFMPITDRHLLMPYYIMFRYKDSLAKQMYLHTQDMAKVIAKQINDQRTDAFKYGLITVLVHTLFRIQWFGAWLNGPLYHVKKDICTQCGKCVKECPAANITMVNGYPKFSNKCTMCMNCVVTCPVDAVRPGVLNWWRVNKRYPFKELVSNKDIPSDYIQNKKFGYFTLFKRYYKNTQREIDKLDK